MIRIQCIEIRMCCYWRQIQVCIGTFLFQGKRINFKNMVIERIEQQLLLKRFDKEIDLDCLHMASLLKQVECKCWKGLQNQICRYIYHCSGLYFRFLSNQVGYSRMHLTILMINFVLKQGIMSYLRFAFINFQKFQLWMNRLSYDFLKNLSILLMNYFKLYWHFYYDDHYY